MWLHAYAAPLVVAELASGHDGLAGWAFHSISPGCP